MKTSHTLIRGTGLKVNEDEEIFQVGKDWALVNFKNGGAHYFHGKREAMNFLKQSKVVNK